MVRTECNGILIMWSTSGSCHVRFTMYAVVGFRVLVSYYALFFMKRGEIALKYDEEWKGY